MADRDQLGDPVVAVRQLPQLRDEVLGRVAGRARQLHVGAGIRAPDLPAAGGLRRRNPLGRLAAPIAQQLRPQTGLGKPVDPQGGRNDLEAAPPLPLADVEALTLQL